MPSLRRRFRPDAIQRLACLPVGAETAFRMRGWPVFRARRTAAALAVALAFDVSDPHRVTRRAAHGFWQHIVAAPAIVNTVALSLLDAGHPAALFPVLALFAAFAVIIDRRSFLLASCLHVVALANAVTEGEGAWAAILGLGVVLLALGSFWTQARSWLVGVLPARFPRQVLPPIHSG